MIEVGVVANVVQEFAEGFSQICKEMNEEMQKTDPKFSISGDAFSRD